MKYFLAVNLFAYCVLAFYFALRFWCLKGKKYVENRLVGAFCFASGIWSLGFSALMLQTDPYRAYLCRSAGMIGVFLYLIIAQVLVCHISGIKRCWRWWMDGFSFTGIIVYFLVIQKDQTVYYLSDMGMTYYFKAGFCNNVYIIYTIIVCVNLLAVIFYMIRVSKVKRVQALGRSFLFVAILIIFGMVLDTIFPLMGMAAIPGSSLTQFWGTLVFWYAQNIVDRSRITIKNMSEVVYYSLAVPIMIFDSNKKIQLMNDAAASFLGISQNVLNTEEIRIEQIFDIEEQEAFVFDEKRKDVDAVCLRNQLYCSLTVNKIEDTYEDIIGYIVIATDLSERIKAMQKLEEAIKEAEKANRAKSTFLANMSHEIRTPMNAIIGFSELLLKMDVDSQVREYAEDIKSSSKNLLAIINDILDISKIESGKMELVCSEYYTEGLFNDVFLIIQAQAEKKGLDFQVKIASDMPAKLYGDKIRIRGVLINLLNNAVKYTMKGKVSLEVNVLKRKDNRVTLEFKVADTGIGIKEEELERIFESFSQVDRKVHYGEEGTGLGLAIVKGYVTLMNGEVTVSSVYGEGTVFTVVLEQKVVDEKLPDRSYIGEKDNSDAFSFGTIKVSGVQVLVVDDNRVNLKVAQSSLEYYGFTVDIASSGEEAIALCKEKHYQMIFMDQMMPQMDGIEAMKQIRKLEPYYDFGGEGKIIVLTANTISGIREQLIQEGFDEYLGKPINYKQLERLAVRFLPEEKLQREKVGDVAQPEMDKKQLEQEELQKTLPQVKIAQGIANCGGKLLNYFDVLRMICRDGEKQLAELKKLQEQGDYPEYTVKIHALKGTAMNIGAEQIAELARAQEKAGREGNTSYIDAHMEEFQQEYHLLLDKLQMVLPHDSVSENVMAEEKKEENEETDFRQILKEIRKCVEDFDFAGASKLLREAKRERIPEQYAEVYAQLGQWMDEMEIEKMLNLLDEYTRL